MSSTRSTTTITRDDLEAKFRALQDGVTHKVEGGKQSLMAVAGGVGLFLLVLMFLLGRRSGKKKTTFVEIRRF
jgi:hypothetical protein